MTPMLIPQPKSVRARAGRFPIPRSGTVAISDESLYAAARQARALFRNYDIGTAVSSCHDPATIVLADGLKPGGYRLDITARGVRLKAESPAAAVHGVQTLLQVAAQAKADTLPCLSIADWPDFPERGVYYDVCRGRVPKLERLFELTDNLARFKINHLQLYIEHTFRFRGHPDIGKGASPLTAEDILQLDACCRERHVELVPSLASFGHLATVLCHPRYRDMAEDWGIGKYVDPEAPKHRCIRGWTLSPANPRTYEFLDSLFAEFLPLFHSDRFNVCCDETWDLGLGQTHDLCARKGKGRVYLDHIVRLNRICRKYGKRTMIWGDIIRNYPELIPHIPRDVTVLDWGYSGRMDFDRIRDFIATGLDSYVCPTVCGYVSLFPRIHESTANIAGWARAGVRHGAKGLLNTDWGDGGHYNFTECAWYGYALGAEQAWNAGADLPTFPERFCRVFLNVQSRTFVRALRTLGDIAQTSCTGYYQSLWRHVFFARPGDAVLGVKRVPSCVSREGRIGDTTLDVNAALGRGTLRRLERIRHVFGAEAGKPGVDPLRVLPYWLFSVDTLIHAARKLAVLGRGGSDSPAERRRLKREMTALMHRFEKLWMARNRRSEIRITLKNYRTAIDAL